MATVSNIGPLTTSERLRIFVFDSPRCCSHLFRKLFTQHHQLGHIVEPYLVPSVFGPEGATRSLQCSPAAKDTINSLIALHPGKAQISYDDANAALTEDVHNLEQRQRVPWIKDHALYCIRPEIVLATLRFGIPATEVLQRYPNPTEIDTSLLESFTPVFLIRHPALVVRSYWEVNVGNVDSDIQDEQLKWMVSARWVRILFDYFRQLRGGRIPLVVDAEDVVYRTSELTHALCQHLGIDRNGVSYSWQPGGSDHNDPGHFFHARLKASSGIETSGDGPIEKNLDLNILAQSWEATYGAFISNSMKRLTGAELPDYTYLKEYKLLS